MALPYNCISPAPPALLNTPLTVRPPIAFPKARTIYRDAAHSVERLPSMHWVPLPTRHKAGGAVHTCDPSTRGPEAGGSGVCSHPWLHIRFEASLGYMRPCQKRRKEESVYTPSPSSYSLQVFLVPHFLKYSFNGSQSLQDVSSHVPMSPALSTPIQQLYLQSPS